MTIEEFSNEFDVLYNNLTSNQAPGLDQYEKSVFLTRAQNEILLSYFNPKSNKTQEGYDGSHRRQIDFSNVTFSETYSSDSKFSLPKFDPRPESKSIKMPFRILMVLNERLVVTRESSSEPVYLTVVPIRFDEYDRLMNKPFKRPLKNQAWRLFNYGSGAVNADLIVGPGDKISSYTIRYVQRPYPIILDNLDGLTIDGEKDPHGCDLDPIIHREILQRAVELAKASYTGDLGSQILLGQTSQTDIGHIQSK